MPDQFETAISELALQIRRHRETLPIPNEEMDRFADYAVNASEAMERHTLKQTEMTYSDWRKLELARFACVLLSLGLKKRFPELIHLCEKVGEFFVPESSRISSKYPSLPIPRDNVDRLFETFFVQLAERRLGGNPTPSFLLEKHGIRAEDLLKDLNQEPYQECEHQRGHYRLILFAATCLAYSVEVGGDLTGSQFRDEVIEWNAKRKRQSLLEGGGPIAIDPCFILAALCESTHREGRVLRRRGLSERMLIESIEEARNSS